MKIAIGLSGGVDSSMAALLLKRADHEVTGITMSLWDGSIALPESESSGCFGPGETRELSEIEDIAKRLDIPHTVIPLADQYKKSVLDYFRSEYKAGRTPNPCVKCNQLMKFGFLIDSARALGLDFDYFATGHYARVTDGGTVLRMAKDPKKDQSYFLSRLKPAQLAQVMFPLGESVKDDIKNFARANGFKDLADKPESQDFIECDDYSVLFDKSDIREGDFVDMQGNVLGRHQGIVHYTIGQRKGLGIGGLAEPLYVVRLDAKDNQVVLGPREELYSEFLRGGDFNPLAISAGNSEGRCLAKIRHGHKAEPAAYKLKDGVLTVHFDAPQLSVTPGQVVALYDGDIVLGSAIIERGAHTLEDLT